MATEIRSVIHQRSACEACNGLDDDGDGTADEGTLIDIGSCLVDDTLENAAQNRCNVGAERCVDGRQSVLPTVLRSVKMNGIPTASMMTAMG